MLQVGRSPGSSPNEVTDFFSIYLIISAEPLQTIIIKDLERWIVLNVFVTLASQ
jgi:hypothetical protein